MCEALKTFEQADVEKSAVVKSTEVRGRTDHLEATAASGTAGLIVPLNDV